MSEKLVALTVAIVGSFVEGNKLDSQSLPGLIQTVHSALAGIENGPEPEAAPAPIKLTPGQIRKSITPDALISFEDGKGYKTLKRHLAGRGLTPAAYKAKWGLPADYPTTAPAYSATRSAMAHSLGLGRKKAEPDAPVAKAKRAPKKGAAKE